MNSNIPWQLKPDDISVTVLEVSENTFRYVLTIIAGSDLNLTVESVDEYTSKEVCRAMAREMISECTTEMKMSGRVTNNFH